MTQKQTFGLILGVLVIGFAFFFVYKQYAPGSFEDREMTRSSLSAKQGNQNILQEVPSDIDGISSDIEAETELDLAALEEESGETAEVEADNQSVNNLGTSYDENSL